MANLPEVKRLLREDFTEVKGDWIDKLIYPINMFNEQVYSVLNKSLTFEDNMAGDIYTTTFSTSSRYISHKEFSVINIPWSNRAAPRIILIGKINEAETSNIITNPVSITDWIQTGPGVIAVRFIVGLHNSTKYNISFMIL